MGGGDGREAEEEEEKKEKKEEVEEEEADGEEEEAKEEEEGSRGSVSRKRGCWVSSCPTFSFLLCKALMAASLCIVSVVR